MAAGPLALGLLLGGCSDGVDDEPAAGDRFSFFVTSMAGLLDLAPDAEGFGGDLSFSGQPGVLGADAICATLAERSLSGAGDKGWKAFLSTSTEHAIDRISGGPWFDRQGRKLANDKDHLIGIRPDGADSAIVDDLPNETGIPNHLDIGPECAADSSCRDNHDVLTGSDQRGHFMPANCEDWTSLTAPGEPTVGHAWPAQSGRSWIAAHKAGGCGRGVRLEQTGAPKPNDLTVGAGGGYGAFYCFASTP
jgi:hypothetical protein